MHMKQSTLIRSAAVGLALASSAWLVSRADAGDGAKIDEARGALERWVETRKIISQEERDFALSKEILQDRIALVKRDIESVKVKIAEAQTTIAETDKKKAELAAENDVLKQESAKLSATIADLEKATAALLVRAPDPVRERVKPLSQRFPEKPEETKLSLSERWQNVIGVLNEMAKFHRELVLASEVRTLPDGSSVEVTTLYLGLAQAYYVNAAGTVGAIGTSTAQGWSWKPANEVAPLIAQTIGILKGEKVAAFVQLPVQVQ